VEIHYSGTTTSSGLSGMIYDCGIGDTGDFPPAVSGNIALIERGSLTFAQKVTHAMNVGAIAAIIYDNTANPLSTSTWTLGSSGSWIPALQVTQASGLAILAGLPAGGTVVNERDVTLAYQIISGTSMACPHVAGAVAFAALNFPAETMTQRISRIKSHVTPVPALAGKTSTGGRLDLLKMIDTDSDGLPDWWEGEHFTGLTENAAGDDDGDGFPNLDEFLAATGPKDPASYLAFSAAAPVVDGALTHFDLTFPSVGDRCYQIEWSDTLESGSWQPLGATVIGTGSLLQIRDANAVHAAARRFYRMQVLHD
jgi:subtilisin family serine protease